jgi:hypothetical protein
MHALWWTLSSTAAPHPIATAKNLSERRTLILQRNLDFLDIPIPETQVWETLEDEQRTLVIETLARRIVKATLPNQTTEKDHD